MKKICPSDGDRITVRNIIFEIPTFKMFELLIPVCVQKHR